MVALRKGQSAVEYLLIIVAVLMVIGISVHYLRGTTKNVPYYNQLVLDPLIFKNATADYGDVKIEAHLVDNGDGTYKVEYKIQAVKAPVRKAQLALICLNKPPNVAGYQVITHEGPLEPINYWANYWTPVPEEYFPCEIRFYIWKD
ncbi:hypothetical protein [Thermococcus guaymasensis]|uniref:hypothetical protein n=1 Tax=Thermococcus guaymasensis TaxID=110164 RepID=UPI001FE0EDEA|nr:hypothetical protein [Thermococcus guaymasensis]